MAIPEDSQPLLDDDIEDSETSSPPQDAVSSRVGILQSPLVYLAACCLFAIVSSSLTTSVLALRSAWHAYSHTHTALKRPNIYAGLESAHWDTPRCLKRTIYPSDYSVLSGSRESRVHAPRDEVLFGFGGDRIAYLTFYVGDFGLENCTLSFRTSYADIAVPNITRTHNDGVDHEPHGTVRPGYLASTTTIRAPDGAHLAMALDNGNAIASLPFDGGEGTLTSSPFWCISSRYMRVRVECPGECDILFGLQGMTRITASALSRTKTGFVLTQYDDVSCIS